MFFCAMHFQDNVFLCNALTGQCNAMQWGGRFGRCSHHLSQPPFLLLVLHHHHHHRCHSYVTICILIIKAKSNKLVRCSRWEKWSSSSWQIWALLPSTVSLCVICCRCVLSSLWGVEDVWEPTKRATGGWRQHARYGLKRSPVWRQCLSVQDLEDHALFLPEYWRNIRQYWLVYKQCRSRGR